MHDISGKILGLRNIFITCFKQIKTLNNGSNLLLVGTNQGSIEVWSLDRLIRLANFASKVKKAVISFAFSKQISEVLPESLFVTFGPLDKTKARFFGTMKGLSEFHLFKIKFDENGKLLLQSKGYSRILQHSNTNKKVTYSRLLYFEILPCLGTEKCLFIWQVGRSSSAEICMELLNFDKIIDIRQNEDEQKNWFTVFNVECSGPIVNGLLLLQSVVDFESQMKLQYVDELFTSNPNLSRFRQCYSVSFDILIGSKGFVNSYSFLGAPQQRLHNIANEIQNLNTSEKLSNELRKCVNVGLLHSLTDDIMFDLFDLLLQQNMLATLCKHISVASRLGPIAAWTFKKTQLLQNNKLFSLQFDNPKDLPSYHQTNAISLTIHNLIVIVNSLFNESHKLDIKKDDYSILLECSKILEKNSQYLELWCWFFQHDLLFADYFNPCDSFDKENSMNIQELSKFAQVDLAYPPKTPRHALFSIWEHSDHLTNSLLAYKLQFLYYYLIDCSVKATLTPNQGFQHNKVILHSFTSTFSQILTPIMQKVVQGYWLLDNYSISHAKGADAAKYLSLDKQNIRLLDAACSNLTFPGSKLDWSGKIFKQFLELDENVAEIFLNHGDINISKKEQFHVLRLILPKNLFLSLHFIRKFSQVTLQYDVDHFKDLLFSLFGFCKENHCIESLFLFPFNHIEENLLMEFLSSINHKNDLRVLYFLQRSQFVKGISIAENSNATERYSNLVNNYKSVLPHALFDFASPSSKSIYHKIPTAVFANSSFIQNNNFDQNDNHLGGMDMDYNNSPSSASPPQRLLPLLKTPKTERVRSQLLKHDAFIAPSLEQSKRKNQPFTPHVVPNTPVSRIRMVHGSAKFAPFQPSSARRPNTPHRTLNKTPKSIPFSAV